MQNDQLEELKRRLHAVHWPAPIDGEQWDDGASLAFIKKLADHWRSRFDWRTHEARLNRLPQYIATVSELDIHFVHQPGKGPAPLPLILSHGWPGCALSKPTCCGDDRSKADTGVKSMVTRMVNEVRAINQSSGMILAYPSASYSVPEPT